MEFGYEYRIIDEIGLNEKAKDPKYEKSGESMKRNSHVGFDQLSQLSMFLRLNWDTPRVYSYFNNQFALILLDSWAALLNKFKFNDFSYSAKNF